MSLTPGGGRTPSAPGGTPPRPPRDARETPPAARAVLSAVRWGLLTGGLVIIADLGTRVILQRTGQDANDTLLAFDQVLNALLLALAGWAVQRETGRIV